MGTAVATQDYREQQIEQRWEFAQRLAAAGDMLPRGLKGLVNEGTPQQRQGIVPGKVFLITETARMLGIDPMAGLQGINVIEGSASISPALMQALVRRAGHKLRVRVYGTIEDGDIRAVATLTRNDDPEPFEVTWTVWDAVRAGLVDSYGLNTQTGRWELRARSADKDLPKPWETYTRSMLKWRAQSEVVRDGAEEVLLGVHYTPEELGAVVRDDGTVEPQNLEQFEAAQDAAIARIKLAKSKADMQVIWDDLNKEDVWIGKVEAEFYTHIGELNVEDAEVVDDDPTESAPAEAEPGEPDDETPPAPESPHEVPEASTGRTAPQPVERTEQEQLDWEAAERAEFEAAIERGEVKP